MLESERLVGEMSELERQRQSALELERSAQIREYISPIAKKACQVAVAFGSYTSPSGCWEYNVDFERQGLRIQKVGAFDANSFLEITYKKHLEIAQGKQVLRINGYNFVDTYVPGKWEEDIEDLYQLAETARKNLKVDS